MNPQVIFGNVEQLLANLSEDDKPSNVISGDPVTMYGELMSKDGLDIGVWTCSVGAWTIENYPVNEVILMLSGKMSLTDSEGNSNVLVKDDLFFIPKGWLGKWEVLEDMEKVYVILS